MTCLKRSIKNLATFSQGQAHKEPSRVSFPQAFEQIWECVYIYTTPNWLTLPMCDKTPFWVFFVFSSHQVTNLKASFLIQIESVFDVWIYQVVVLIESFKTSWWHYWKDYLSGRKIQKSQPLDFLQKQSSNSNKIPLMRMKLGRRQPQNIDI